MAPSTEASNDDVPTDPGPTDGLPLVVAPTDAAPSIDVAEEADTPADPALPVPDEPADSERVEAESVEPAPGKPTVLELRPLEPTDVELVQLEPAESVAAVAPTAVPEGPWVEILARTEPCKFGSNCLVVGYVAHGFDAMPGRFTCEFASGSRFEFRATTAAVDHACATSSLGDSITIEIEGVRSETVVHG
jgi:hypothetical protein